jgi:hypothetical protein
MVTLEDIVYAAYEHGIREDLFIEVDKIKHLPENKYISTVDLYYKAFQSAIMKKMETENIAIETKEWTSALVKSTTYNPMSNTLTVEFNNGKVYEYKEFAKETYQEFLDAESKGKFFLTKIRAVYKDTPEKVIKVTLEA